MKRTKKTIELTEDEYNAVEQRKAELGYRTDRETLLKALGLEYIYRKPGRKRRHIP